MLTTLKTTYSKPLTKLANTSKASPFKGRFAITSGFSLECGDVLDGLTISYSTCGQINADGSNVIWVCHALTADTNPRDWWAGLVGAGKLYNADEHFIVCANLIGSAYGSTSPLNCQADKSYTAFPHISIRDNIKAFMLLKQQLGIGQIHSLVGGSMGGQQAMEWAVMDAKVCKNLILLATCAVLSPWARAFNQSQRLAIEADQSWGQQHDGAALNGLKAARSMAMLSYRNNQVYNSHQSDTFVFNQPSKASRYQSYQGQKLVNRFNAYSYHALTKTMDSHDVGRNRGGIQQALATISAKTLVIGISSDLLFSIEESEQLALAIPDAQMQVVVSNYGHDGFLIEADKITSLIKKFYCAQILHKD
jgi:homoserine O-acetyltransferase